MKKKLALACVVILILGMLPACGKKETEKKKTSSTVEEKKEDTTELESLVTGENMIPNGDMSEGVGAWSVYCQTGNGTIDVKDGELICDVIKNGSKDCGVQLYEDGFSLENGCVYELSFDVRSTIPRVVDARVQLNGGDYHAYYEEFVDSTDTMQTFTFTFTMEEGSDPAPRMVFNIGCNKDESSSLEQHQVIFDNISLKCTDDSNRIIPESIAKTPDININQIGYLKDSEKIAIFRGEKKDTSFDVVNVDNDKVVYSGDITGEVKDAGASETNSYGDFSSVKEEGTYKIVTKNMGQSYEFKIGDNLYDEALKDALKFFYYQRCGIELPKDLTGEFAHVACHTGEATIYGDESNKTVDVSGGWHDAGDYGRYVVSGVKAVEDLFLAYENLSNSDNSADWIDNIGIPESGNQIPDILDECRYELEWLLKMQDETTGGVYHKVTCTEFPETVMPEEETNPLVLAPISNTATGDFAAIMAKAATLYQNIDSSFSSTCLDAAKKAFTFVTKTPVDGSYKNPDTIVTGEYPDASSTDECYWASVELYKTTGEDEYKEAINTYSTPYAPLGLGWASVGYYGTYAYLTMDEKLQEDELTKKCQQSFQSGIKNINDSVQDSGYKVSLDESFAWGSNMIIANNAMMLLMNDTINNNQDGKNSAANHLNYLFGANPTSYCFLTGFGANSPKNTHHRPSQVIGSSLSGMLVGGPDSNLDDPYAKATLAKSPAAKCYVDNVQSYSCNEVTIYWNSPLIYVLSQLK